jgi:hypothetical protein
MNTLTAALIGAVIAGSAAYGGALVLGIAHADTHVIAPQTSSRQECCGLTALRGAQSHQRAVGVNAEYTSHAKRVERGGTHVV